MTTLHGRSIAFLSVLALGCSGDAASRDSGDAGGLSGGGAGTDTDPEPGTDGSDGAGESGDDDGPAGTLEEDAEVVDFQVEPVLACGAAGAAELVLRNTGRSTWSMAGGYVLAPTGADPLGGTSVALPELIEVATGGTWRFEIAMQAPETDGAYTTSWQMTASGSAFGAVASADVDVDCSAPMPELPDDYPIVEQVAAEYGHLLETNTYESCGEFVQHVLAALSAQDPEWGHVGKTAGESQHTPAGWTPMEVDGHTITGFSHDAIFHRASYWQVDIIVNAAANSDPDPSIHGPASITWGVIPQEDYRENNPWIPAVPPP
jgi:hypothetical protein